MASSFNKVIALTAGLGSSIASFSVFNSWIESNLEQVGHDSYNEASNRPYNNRPFSALLLQALNAKVSILPSTKDSNALKLEQVYVITRHGARTPFKLIPGIEPVAWKEEGNVDLQHTLIDISVRTADGGGKPQSAIDNAYLKKQKLKGGSLVGQLTQVGQQEMYDLGLRLKSKYIDQLGFLSPEYNHEEVYVRTTNILRTIKSARCILAGIYGKTTLKHPITMITSVNEHEFMYPNYYFCKNLKHWADIVWSTTAEVPGLVKFCTAIGKRLGIHGTVEELSMVALQDNIHARLAHGHSVPSFLLDKFPEIESFAVQIQLRVIAGTGDSLRIIRNSIGNFVENICTQLEDKIQNHSGYKMLIFSAHDTTLMALLKAIGVYDNKWPRFSSDIKIELYKQSIGKWFVKVLYNDKEMKIPGCESTLCPADRFFERLEKYRVKDWESDCGIKGDYKKETFAIGTI